MLVLVFNYTGDRLNFGLATEQARREGGKVGLGGQGPGARGPGGQGSKGCMEGPSCILCSGMLCSVESVGVDVL